MSTAEKYFLAVIEEIPDAKPGKMFGALCAKMPNNKAAAMFWKDNIVVKLDEESLKEASSLPGSRPFEPMEGRPMREWIQIPYKYHKLWQKYANISADIVRRLEKKKGK